MFFFFSRGTLKLRLSIYSYLLEKIHKNEAGINEIIAQDTSGPRSKAMMTYENSHHLHDCLIICAVRSFAQLFLSLNVI